MSDIDRAVERLKNNSEFIERQRRLGWERGLIYKTLVLTGLRKSELASVTVGQVYLDGPMPYLGVSAANEKSREGAQIPLRSDLAADLGEWLADKRERLRRDATLAVGCQRSAELPADEPLFKVPDGLIRILNRDFKGVRHSQT